MSDAPPPSPEGRPDGPEAAARPRPGTSRPEPAALNIGVPASMPAGSSPWATHLDQPQPTGAGPAPDHPRWGPPDPAAVSGPPWPVLAATGPYTPPPLIRWPAAVGVAAVAIYVGAVLVAAALSGGASTNARSWLKTNEVWIAAFNHDQVALQADNPGAGGQEATWMADWRTLRADAEGAAGAPNPGGAATVPWREMLNDYVAGATEVIQSESTHNVVERAQADRDLQAGDAAALRFYRAMGIRPP